VPDLPKLGDSMLLHIAATAQFFMRVILGLCFGLIAGAMLATFLPIYA